MEKEMKGIEFLQEIVKNVKKRIIKGKIVDMGWETIVLRLLKKENDPISIKYV